MNHTTDNAPDHAPDHATDHAANHATYGADDTDGTDRARDRAHGAP
ncbi:hypothetical protein NKH77_24155 [Streptomyces sp. M19]